MRLTGRLHCSFFICDLPFQRFNFRGQPFSVFGFALLDVGQLRLLRRQLVLQALKLASKDLWLSQWQRGARQSATRCFFCTQCAAVTSFRALGGDLGIYCVLYKYCFRSKFIFHNL